MYYDYYGFTEEPFSITPDPNFLYMSPGHEEALTSIVYGIQGRRGIVALIGEVGIGKSTVCSRLTELLKNHHLRIPFGEKDVLS